MSLANEIILRLEKAYQPTGLELKDDSHLHAGHAGSQGGGHHYTLVMKSSVFVGMSRIARHRHVYQTLDDLLQQNLAIPDGYIHALKLQLDV